MAGTRIERPHRNVRRFANKKILMQTTATRLQAIIDEYLPLLKSLPENKMALKPLPTKWSKKEIIGHLIDSAQNNIRRFIVAQYEDTPAIVYDQDRWVTIGRYQDTNTTDIIDLWYLLNKQIVNIVGNTPEEMKLRQCRTQRPFLDALFARRSAAQEQTPRTQQPKIAELLNHWDSQPPHRVVSGRRDQRKGVVKVRHIRPSLHRHPAQSLI